MTARLSFFAALLALGGCCRTLVSGNEIESGTSGQDTGSGIGSTGGGASTNAGASSTGGGNGTTGGTTGSTTGSRLPSGTPCDAGDECSSGVCGDGLCCSQACPHDSTAECTPFGCSDAGACLYPPAGTTCGRANDTCTGNTQNTGVCDSTGDCIDAGIPCPDNFACDVAGFLCDKACAADINCASGYYCETTGPDLGRCLAQITDGG